MSDVGRSSYSQLGATVWVKKRRVANHGCKGRYVADPKGLRSRNPGLLRRKFDEKAEKACETI